MNINRINNLKKQIRYRQNKITECQAQLEQVLEDIKRIEEMPDGLTKRKSLLFKETKKTLLLADICSARAQILILKNQISQEQNFEQSQPMQ